MEETQNSVGRSLLNDFYEATETPPIPCCRGAISDDTYAFLKARLDEANTTIACMNRRESNHRAEIEKLKRERQDIDLQSAAIKGELQSMRAKLLDAEQRIDKETRLRFGMQDKLNEAEKELNENQTKINVVEEELKRKSATLANAENIAQHIYKLAISSHSQSKFYKEQVEIYSQILTKYKEKVSASKVQEEGSRDVIERLKEEHANLISSFREAALEVDLLRSEAAKQDRYLNDTLNRLKEVSEKFMSMKEWFVENFRLIEEQHQDICKKFGLEREKCEETEEKLKVMGTKNEQSTQREMELESKIEYLLETLNAMTHVRQELEEKRSCADSMIGQLKEDKIKLTAEYDSLKRAFDSEKSSSLELQKISTCLEKEKAEWKNKYDDSQAKIQTLENEAKHVTTSHHNCKDKNTRISTKNKSLVEHLRKLGRQHKLVCEELRSSKDALNVKQTLINQLSEEVRGLETSLGCMHEDMIGLRSDLQQVQTERTKLSDELAGLKGELLEKEFNLRESREKAKCLDANFAQLQQISSDHEERFLLAFEQIKTMSDEARSRDDLIRSLEEKVIFINAQYDESAALKAKLTADLDEARKALNNVIEEKEAVKTRISESVTKITTAIQEEKDQLRAELELARGDLAKAKEKIAELERASTKGQQVLTKKVEDLTAMQSQVSQYESKIAYLTSSCEKLQDKVGVLKKTVTTLTEDLNRKDEVLRTRDSEKSELSKQIVQMQEHILLYENLWEKDREQALKEIEEELRRDLSSKCKWKAEVVGTEDGESLWNS